MQFMDTRGLRQLKDKMINTIMYQANFNVYIEPEVVKGFLTIEECNTLINYNSELYTSKFQNDSYTPKSEIYSLSKTIPNNSDEISGILKKCSKKFNIPHDRFTHLTVVKYTEGGFIREHIDSAHEDSRIYTILLYLNEDYDGGETSFPNLKKRFKLNMGDALFFHNLNTNHNPTELSLHKGEIVKSGVKWIANLWVR